MPMIFKCGRCAKHDDGRPNGAKAGTIRYWEVGSSVSSEQEVCEECLNNFRWWYSPQTMRNAPMGGEIVVKQHPTLLGDINDVCNRDAKRLVNHLDNVIEPKLEQCTECFMYGDPFLDGVLHAHNHLEWCSIGNKLKGQPPRQVSKTEWEDAKPVVRCSDPQCPGQCPKCITREEYISMLPEAATCFLCLQVPCICKPESRGGVGGR